LRKSAIGDVIVRLLSCAFPVFNEEENVGPLLDEALLSLGGFAEEFEIVIVDDGSRDSTVPKVRDYSLRDPRVRMILHPKNLGYGHALRSALTHSRGDAVALVDGDRQFRTADLRKLVDALAEADVVVGYRIVRADPSHRLFIARVYHRVLRALLNVQVRDVDCGFKLFRRAVVDRILPDLESRSAFISPELVIRAQHAGFRVLEVGVPHHPRVAGRSKGATPRVVARTIGEILRLRRSLGGGTSRAGSS
jgi:glycosyltransferase involved in cell wall biosynthesis